MVISPLSVYTSLGIVSLGAGGSTLDEIKKTLNIGDNDHSWLEKLKLYTKNIVVKHLSFPLCLY